MSSIETLTTFFGWCSVLNLGMLSLATLAVVLMRDMMFSIHGKIFGLGETDLSRAYFQYLAQYKIAVIVFNLVPYVALKIGT